MTPQPRAISYDPSPLERELTDLGPRTPVLEGTPSQSVHVLYRDDQARSGIWECTPGRFESARDGDTEFMHFLAGSATITTDDGTEHDIRPGVTLIAPDGWRGTWEIRETVRKVYTIWNAPSAPTPTGESA
jgi:uncharacterized protein